MSKKRTPNPIKIPSAKPGDQPATREMLKAVKEELKEHTNQVKHELKVEIHDIKGEIHQIKGEIHQIKKEVSDLKQSIHKTNILVEEQNANNRIVLEGLQAVWQRQDRLEGLAKTR